MPPEMLASLAKGDKGDTSPCPSADMWALGSVFYHLIFLEPAFKDGKAKYDAVSGYRPPLAGCPGGWDDVISSCWDADPSKRPAACDIEKAVQNLVSQWMSADGKTPPPSIPFSASAPSDDRKSSTSTSSSTTPSSSKSRRSLVRQITYGERDLASSIRSTGSVVSRGRKSPLRSEGSFAERLGKRDGRRREKGERKLSLREGAEASPMETDSEGEEESRGVSTFRSSCLSDFRSMVNVPQMADVHIHAGVNGVSLTFSSQTFTHIHSHTHTRDWHLHTTTSSSVTSSC